MTALWEVASLGAPLNLSQSLLTTGNRTFALNTFRRSIAFSVAIDTSYLSPGGTYLFTILASSPESSTSSASITITVNQAPSAGYLTVTPTSGVAFNTSFALYSVGWNVEPGGYPLEYSFSFQVDSTSPVLSISSQSLLNSAVTALPTGLPSEQYVVVLISEVVDAYSATANVSSSAVVSPLSQITTTAVLNSLVANANISELSSDINLAIQSVNNVATYFKSSSTNNNITVQDIAIGAMCDTLTTVVSTLDSSSSSLSTIVTSFQHLYNTSGVVSVSSLASCLQLLYNLSSTIQGNLPNTYVSPTAALFTEVVSLIIVSFDKFNVDNSSSSAALEQLAVAPTLNSIITALTDGVLANMVGGQAPVSLQSQSVDIKVFNELLSDLYGFELSAADTGTTAVPSRALSAALTSSGGISSATGTVNPNLKSTIVLPVNGLDSCGSSVSGYAQLSLSQLLSSAYSNASSAATPLLRVSSSKSNYAINATYNGVVIESDSNFTLILPFKVIQDFSPIVEISNATFTTTYALNFSAQCFIQTTTTTAPCDCSLVSYNSENIIFTCPVRSGICTSLASSINVNSNSVQGSGYTSVPDITQYGALIESAFE